MISKPTNEFIGWSGLKFERQVRKEFDYYDLGLFHLLPYFFNVAIYLLLHPSIIFLHFFANYLAVRDGLSETSQGFILSFNYCAILIQLILFLCFSLAVLCFSINESCNFL